MKTLTPVQQDLLTEIYDILLNLYALREQAQRRGDGERIGIINEEIRRAEAKRKIIRGWKTRGEVLVVKIRRKSPPRSEAFCGFAAYSRGSICRIRSTSLTAS